MASPTKFKLENRTARILLIALGGGASVSVPPLEPPAPIEITLATDTEKARFERAIATAVVQGWIAAGEFEVTEVTPPARGEAAATAPASPPTPTDNPSYSKHRRI